MCVSVYVYLYEECRNIYITILANCHWFKYMKLPRKEKRPSSSNTL